MADFKLRLSDDLAARFDAWAADRGGRSPALRQLIAAACGGEPKRAGRLERRPAKLTVRLTAADARGLDQAASSMGLTPNAWVAALVRRRLLDRPTFAPAEAVALLAIQGELRRIGINVNQIARAMNTAVLEGKVLDLEVAYLDDLRRETRAHLVAVRDAVAGDLTYWAVEP